MVSLMLSATETPRTTSPDSLRKPLGWATVATIASRAAVHKHEET